MEPYAPRDEDAVVDVERITSWLVSDQRCAIFGESQLKRTLVCPCDDRHVISVTQVRISAFAAVEIIRVVREWQCVTGELPHNDTPTEP